MTPREAAERVLAVMVEAHATGIRVTMFDHDLIFHALEPPEPSVALWIPEPGTGRAPEMLT